MPDNSPVSLDDFDQKILVELERDGVLTAAALSERVGLSPSACHRRVKAMEAAGVIEGYAAILSEKALGRSATVRGERRGSVRVSPASMRPPDAITAPREADRAGLGSSRSVPRVSLLTR